MCLELKDSVPLPFLIQIPLLKFLQNLLIKCLNHANILEPLFTSFLPAMIFQYKNYP